jgi:IS30 family transposase
MAMCAYRQLSMYDRNTIERGLSDGLSLRKVAKMTGRATTSISREIRANRTQKKGRGKMAECVEKAMCATRGLCAACTQANRCCRHCPGHDCRTLCDTYILRTACPRLGRGPWVCNGCKKSHWGCTRPLRFEYAAAIADHISAERKSACRCGVDMDEARFAEVMRTVRPAIARGLSPYETATLYADEVKVSPSTLYRWVARGYGGMANIELQRKVGFAPRKKTAPRRQSHHGPDRSFEAFCALPEEEQAAATEMDTVWGRKRDVQCILSLHKRPAHFQLYALLAEKTLEEFVAMLDRIERIVGREGFEEMFDPMLTDNGSEFEDPEALEASVTEPGRRRCRVFYCDPRQSQQKGRCEKNHTELRQILPKGRKRVSFDALNERDAATACSHANSTPRKSLCNMTPIAMFKAAFGGLAEKLLDALGVREVRRDELMLKREVLNVERASRGEEPIDFSR